MQQNKPKPIVILYSETLSSYLLYAELIRTRPDLIACMIRLPVVPRRAQGRQSMYIRIARRAAFAFLWFNVLTIAIYGIVARIYGNRLEDLAARHNIPVKTYPAITKALLDQLTHEKPAWILNNSPNILKNNLLQIPSIGTLNYHAAPLPEFRGAGNYFWLFVEDAHSAKATLHYVVERLDAGDIITYSDDIMIQPHTTVYDVWYGLRHQGYVAWQKIMPHLQDATPAPAIGQDESKRRIRSFPGKHAVAAIRKKGHTLMSWDNFMQMMRIAKTGHIVR